MREPLQNFSADLLEFEPLRELVGRYIGSPLGRAELENLAPHTDRAVLEGGLEDVAEAIRLACTQPKGSRIIEIRMRTMAESLA